MYKLDEVDRAGNRYTILKHDDFDYVCNEAINAKRIKPSHIYLISNPDNVDVDWPDGLTDEEWEKLP